METKCSEFCRGDGAILDFGFWIEELGIGNWEW
jgi:hypothetical protein